MLLFGRIVKWNSIFSMCNLRQFFTIFDWILYNICFDFLFSCHRQHKIRGGEEILDIFDYVEDTKGNPNERGRLLVTNLRLIWYSLNNNKFNLCMFPRQHDIIKFAHWEFPVQRETISFNFSDWIQLYFNNVNENCAVQVAWNNISSIHFDIEPKLTLRIHLY